MKQGVKVQALNRISPWWMDAGGARLSSDN